MIIFDLDDCLANCEHRWHFVDHRYCPHTVIDGSEFRRYPKWYDKESDTCIVPCDLSWKPDWKSFYEACDKDHRIDPVLRIFNMMCVTNEVEIWSGRCESIRAKTLSWLDHNINVDFEEFTLKMRPIGNHAYDYDLKEHWYNIHSMENPNQKIDFVFDSDPKSIDMWRRRGVFVFDVNQNGFK